MSKTYFVSQVLQVAQQIEDGWRPEEVAGSHRRASVTDGDRVVRFTRTTTETWGPEPGGTTLVSTYGYRYQGNQKEVVGAVVELLKGYYGDEIAVEFEVAKVEWKQADSE